MSDSTAVVLDLLAECGLAPRDCERSVVAASEDASVGLLPMLISAWRQASESASSTNRKSAQRLIEQLSDWHARGTRLTLGVPGTVGQAAGRWLGTRLALWPRGIPAGRRVGIVSSRLGRAPDTEEKWFTVLRAACSKIDPRQELLLSATSTTTAPFVERAAALFGLRVLHIEVPDDDELPLDKWFFGLPAALAAEQRANRNQLVLSPPLVRTEGVVGDAVDSTPNRDRALVALSDRLLAFRVRRSGNVHRLIEARLKDAAWPVASVYVALGPQLVRTEMAGKFMDAGAVGWVVCEPPEQPATDGNGAECAGTDDSAGRDSFDGRSAKGPPPRQAGATIVEIAAFPSPENWAFVTHCTRRRGGPWPGQEDLDFLDDLILARDDAQHSALSALKRIVRQRRLIATARTIRGGTPVVSFTAVPLAELHRLRVFRPHRGRWDFEPYGICIHRDWLRQHGARPVCYGDDMQWESLSLADRPFFQLRTTRRRSGDSVIDWTVEDEWRVVGDLDLAEIPHDAALVFAPTLKEAQEIAALSRWPVTVVPMPEG